LTFPPATARRRASLMILEMIGIQFFGRQRIHLAQMSLGVTEASAESAHSSPLFAGAVAWATCSFPEAGRWSFSSPQRCPSPSSPMRARVVLTGLHRSAVRGSIRNRILSRVRGLVNLHRRIPVSLGDSLPSSRALRVTDGAPRHDADRPPDVRLALSAAALLVIQFRSQGEAVQIRRPFSSFPACGGRRKGEEETISRAGHPRHAQDVGLSDAPVCPIEGGTPSCYNVGYWQSQRKAAISTRPRTVFLEVDGSRSMPRG